MSWRCTWCGRVYDDEEPASCETCGRDSFEGVGEDAASTDETVDTGVQYVWVCPNCDREHVKNNPPCSRCLNPTLEKRAPSYEDVERDLDVPSWLEVAKPYTPIIIGFVLIVALFASGILPLSLLPGIGDEVPGSADETNGIEHAAVEAEIHDRLEAHREAEGAPSREYDDGLATYAEEYNQRLVTTQHTDREPARPDHETFDLPCESQPSVGPFVSEEGYIDDFDSSAELGAALTDGLLESEFAANLESSEEYEGIDVHVGPDGGVYVLYATC